MLKKLLAVFAVCIAVSGCADADTLITKEDVQLKQLKTQQLKQKLEEKSTFVLMVSQNTCNACELMERTILPFSRTHADIEIVELKLDEQGEKIADTDQAFRDIQKLIPAFSGSTPQFFYFREGDMKKTEQGALSELAWQNYMIDCGLLNGKKIKEEEVTYPLTLGTYLKEATITAIGRKLKNKESFYLYHAREDRYNASFSKKLSEFSDKEKVKVIVLNSSGIVQPEGDKERKAMDEGMSIINSTMSLSLSPSVYYIENGEVKAVLKDNVSEKEIRTWFAKNPQKN